MSTESRTHAAGHRSGEAAPETERPAATPIQTFTAAIGNRAFTQLSRQGDGILAGGRVDPSVERAIASRRGGGEALDSAVRQRFAPGLGNLDDVRVHTDAGAHALARSVSARAFVVGTDVYFGRGEYRPGTSDGDRLLAHELTHVTQQRGASATGGLTVSQPGDHSEIEADRVADKLAP